MAEKKTAKSSEAHLNKRFKIHNADILDITSNTFPSKYLQIVQLFWDMYVNKVTNYTTIALCYRLFFLEKIFERAGNSCNSYRRMSYTQFIRKTEPENFKDPGLIKEKLARSP